MASTKTLLQGAKKIEFTQLTLKDKKSFKILLTLSRSDKWAKIPLASAQDADTLKTFSIDLETLLRVAFALSKEQNIYIYTESVKDDDGSHTEYFVHKLDDGEKIAITDETFSGKVLKGDIIRPSSAKTASTSASTSATPSKKEADKEKAEKQADDDYIDNKVKAITAEIEKILPNYGKFEKSKLAMLSVEIEKIIKKQFDC